MQEHRVEIDPQKCVGCGMCAAACVTHNIKIEGGKAQLILERCLACGHCTAICPKEAVQITGYAESPVPRQGQARLDPEEVLQAIRFRRSVREFQDKKIPEAVVRQILEAGRLTHTAKNLQDVSFLVLDRQKDAMERMAVRLFRAVKPFVGLFSATARNNPISDHFFFFHAPLVIVIASKEPVNGILAAQNMEFAAEANGLGVLFSGFFTTCARVSPRLKRALGVPKGKKAAATLVLGYPRLNYLRAPQREPLDVKYL